MSFEVSKLAAALVRSGCLKFGNFKLKSGIISPYYIDLTWLLSSPRDFRFVVDTVADEIKKLMVHNKVDRLVSIALKGALFLPSIACKLNLPCLIVRKAEKKYGMTGQVAGGQVAKGEHLLFFDDVITDGKSKLSGIRPLEQLGAIIGTVMVVVDREQGGREKLQKVGYNFASLVTISELVKSLRQSSFISDEKAKGVLGFISYK
ncbi:MAG: hypothetical protein JSV51_09335 [Candidatus Bathyarchaeota archaeon]|nr:MAG: hypothetical protein JSV51_09335 [Candidatus Bathyarchaeota archaeon]